MKLAQEIAFSHHEHWAGDGYPNGLRGEGIPLSGRIVAVADVYDGLTHVRPYKPKWSVDDAVKEIVTTAGKKFDPKVVEAFVEVLVERGVYRRHGLFRDKTGQLLKF
jgi:putative two-component system response regulator